MAAASILREKEAESRKIWYECKGECGQRKRTKANQYKEGE
jgi:hypothetical protein